MSAPPGPATSPSGRQVPTTGIRAATVLLALASAWYVPWLALSLNTGALWLGLPFLVANVLVLATALVAGMNNWTRTAAESKPLPEGDEPTVAVVVPTCGEPLGMVRQTLLSVLRQRWPHERLVVLLSDDAHRRELRQVVVELAADFPRATLRYTEPPAHGDPGRHGDAKAGNLNHALAHLDREAEAGRLPVCAFVETRDADDEVGHQAFLRECLGHLVDEPDVAYVQTVKEAQVADGDPFGNRDLMFYRGAMLARHAGGAVFPCGSGLVWRRSALDDIGGFPTWNLVEDLHSGLEALCRGWRGTFLPIVGAVAQHAPEDIANVYKQRGTWALDTVRLALWGDHRGLSLRQRLFFAELPLFYAQGLALLLFLACPSIGFLTGTLPVTTTQASYALHFWPAALAVELLLVALNTGHPYEVLWRARQLWVGLAPVFARAWLLAVAYGPRRKPVYRVTRKIDVVGWYWRETLVQWALVAALVVGLAVALLRDSVLLTLDLGSAYWGALLGALMVTFLRRSWYRVDVQGVLRARLVTALARLRVLTIDHGRVLDLHLDPRPAGVDLTVVVPTRDEAESVRPLAERVREALDRTGWTWELVFVDDSDDTTPLAVGLLSVEDPRVRLLHRPAGERHDGLSGAVLRGFADARGRALAVMDGDLQHPPRVLPLVAGPVLRGEVDLATGTRFVPGGGTAGLDGVWRQVVSRGSRHVVHALFRRTRTTSDPLGGFFVVDRRVVDGVDLRPTGFKILLEVLMQGRWSSAAEVPYTFEERRAGTSQAGWQEGLRFARHLGRLRLRSALVVGMPPTRRDLPARLQIDLDEAHAPTAPTPTPTEVLS